MLETAQSHFKALFLVGGPGSGKDIIIKAGLQESGMIEVNLDRLYKSITNQTELDEFREYSSVFINGNADDYSKIATSKLVLEAMGYDTSMVYVYTSQEESKRRNDVRIDSGAKTISEDARHSKYNYSVENMLKFSTEFVPFILYNNSVDYNVASVSERTEIGKWTRELFEQVSNFISAPPQQPKSLAWLVEQNKIDTTNINLLFEGVIANEFSQNDSVLFQSSGLDEASPFGNNSGGIARSDKNRAEIENQDDDNETKGIDDEDDEDQEKNDKTKPTKSKNLTKRATNPGAYFDSRIGTVPSGGVGLSANLGESRKSFKDFRSK